MKIFQHEFCSVIIESLLWIAIKKQMQNTLVAFAYDARYGCVCTEAEKYLHKSKFLSSLFNF